MTSPAKPLPLSPDPLAALAQAFLDGRVHVTGTQSHDTKGNTVWSLSVTVDRDSRATAS